MATAVEPEVCAEYARILARPENGGVKLGKLERFAFYERSSRPSPSWPRARRAVYGCVLLKGVIGRLEITRRASAVPAHPDDGP